MFTMLGAAFGPVIGDFLIRAFNWQYIFLVNLPVGIVAIIISQYILPQQAPVAPKAKIDIPGVLLVFITGFALCAVALFLLSTISAHTSVGNICVYLFLLGAGTSVAFSPLNSAVMGEWPAKDRGSTRGLVKMMTNPGSSLGVAAVMLVATIAAGPKLVEVSSHALSSTDLAGVRLTLRSCSAWYWRLSVLC